MPQPYVHIELDRPRKLRFRHNDLADLEMQSGKGLSELMTSMSMHGIRLLLCYGLRWQDKPNEKMTPTKAGELIDAWMANGKTFAELTQKMLDGLRASGYLDDEPADEAATEGNESPEAAATE